MNFIISGKNIEVTARETIEQKLGKLERYFTPETEITVTLSVEKERQKIEVTIPVKGTIIRSEQTSNDMYVSIDLVEEIIERQLRKYASSPCIRKTPACRWSFWDTASSYSPMPRPTKSTLYTRERMVHSD